MTYPNNITPEELENAHRAAVRVARFMAGRLPYWIDAEQVALEAAVGVHRAALEFRPGEGASFTYWASVVAQRAAQEELRRQSPWTRKQRADRRASLEAGLEPAGWMLPPMPLDTPVSGHCEELGTLAEAVPGPNPWPATEARLLVGQLLAGLEPRRRFVIEREHLHGESRTKIAAALGISVSRVQQLHDAALAQLQIAAGTREAPEPKQIGRPKGKKNVAALLGRTESSARPKPAPRKRGRKPSSVRALLEKAESQPPREYRTPAYGAEWPA